MKVQTNKRITSVCVGLLAVLLSFSCACGQQETDGSEISESSAVSLTAQSSEGGSQEESDPSEQVASLLDSLTVEQKVGQLFCIRPEQLAESYILNEDSVLDPTVNGINMLNDDMRAEYEKYPVGGFILFARNIESPEQLESFTDDLTSLGAVKPIIAVDEEGGIVTRIGSNELFDVPEIGTMESIGSTGDTENARYAGAAIGEYLARYGIFWDFAPVADLNTNPDNIIIGNRAFGSEPYAASDMVSAYIDGLHEYGVCSTIKHFPGHGDTYGDTHDGFVAVYKTWDELLETEIVPFQKNLDKTDAVMTAHITLPNVTGDGLPASLSYDITTEKLRGELGFNGVVVTDSLAMGAITANYTSAEAALTAFNAGCDVLLSPEDFRLAYDSVLDAVKNGQISMERLDESVSRILTLKQCYE